MAHQPLRIGFFLLIALLATATSAQERVTAGVYRASSGIEVRTVTLLDNGSYLARWDGDIGPNGRAKGTWKQIGDEVRLTPSYEEGLIKGYFRVLLLRSLDGTPSLLRKEDASATNDPFANMVRQSKVAKK